MDVKMSQQELKKLRAASAKLDALEAGGVDNWEGYDESLAEYRTTVEREEEIESLLADVCEILCEGIDQPAGSGCGYGFKDGVQDKALQLMLERIEKLTLGTNP